MIGLGGMGSAIAHRLASRGARVVGFEQFGEAHALGSSHGGSRVIREAYFEHPSYVPLVQRAYELWRETEAAAGVELMTLTGGLMIGAPESEVVAGSLASTRRFGLAHELLDAAEIRRRHPEFTPADDQVAVYELRSGFVRPEAAVRAHVSLARELGAELHFERRVEGWATSASGIELRAGGDRWSVDRLVVAAGAWSGPLLRDLGLPLEPCRVVMFWFEPDDPPRFEVGRSPVHLWDDPEQRLLYGVPLHGDPRAGVKVAFYRTGDPVEPDAVDRRVSPAEKEAMRAHLATRVPGLAGACLDARVCLYTNTPDQHFAIGPHPGDGRIVLLAGFSGHGFKFVPAIAEVASGLALDGRSPHDIALFDPGRFRLRTPGLAR